MAGRTRQITLHAYEGDGTRDHRGEGRCVHCGMPKRNERHALPDRKTEMDESRRRAGENEET